MGESNQPVKYAYWKAVAWLVPFFALPTISIRLIESAGYNPDLESLLIMVVILGGSITAAIAAIAVFLHFRLLLSPGFTGWWCLVVYLGICLGLAGSISMTYMICVHFINWTTIWTVFLY